MFYVFYSVLTNLAIMLSSSGAWVRAKGISLDSKCGNFFGERGLYFLWEESFQGRRPGIKYRIAIQRDIVYTKCLLLVKHLANI